MAARQPAHPRTRADRRPLPGPPAPGRGPRRRSAHLRSRRQRHLPLPDRRAPDRQHERRVRGPPRHGQRRRAAHLQPRRRRLAAARHERSTPRPGFITGRPTSTFNQNLTFIADDGVAVDPGHDPAQGERRRRRRKRRRDVPRRAPFRRGASPQLYTHTLDISEEFGVGPFVFGATDLPPGLTLDGDTGVISGIPTAAGTYFASLSAFDFGEDNKVVSVVPIVILPAASDFRFLTQFLNNGEVGTPYCDTWLTENAAGTVDVRRLRPAARAWRVDAASGLVSGTPTLAGTFLVLLSASDGGEHDHDQPLDDRGAPASASSFHWNYFGLPTAIVNESYDRQPPILVAAEGSVGAVTYSVVGLPVGMTYSAGSGELSGTPIEIGEYPLTFSAVDGANSETLTLSLLFVVLPPGGGDVSQIPVNFWVFKESLKLVRAGARRLARVVPLQRRPPRGQPLRSGRRHAAPPARLADPRARRRARSTGKTEKSLRLAHGQGRGARREGEARAREADALLVDEERHLLRDRARHPHPDRHDREPGLPPAADVRRERRLPSGARLREARLRGAQREASPQGPGRGLGEAVVPARRPELRLRGADQPAPHPHPRGQRRAARPRLHDPRRRRERDDGRPHRLAGVRLQDAEGRRPRRPDREVLLPERERERCRWRSPTSTSRAFPERPRCTWASSSRSGPTPTTRRSPSSRRSSAAGATRRRCPEVSP